MLKGERLALCLALADLQVLDVTDLVVLTLADVTNLTRLGEHRPEHADFVGAVAERVLVLQASKAYLPYPLCREGQVLDEGFQGIVGGKHHSPVVDETLADDVVVDAVLDFGQ